ncbi:hypothetical protein ACFL2O_03285 [Thermodesulfobacteriota bacterium]
MEITTDHIVSGALSGEAMPDAMHILSADLFQGCGYFAKKARTADGVYDTIVNNTACVLFGMSAMEAKTNEWASILYQPNANSKNDPMIEKLKKIQSIPGMKDKWNRIASDYSGTDWNLKKDPFKTYEMMQLLKNMLINYGEENTGKEEYLCEELSELMQNLNPDNLPIKKFSTADGMSDLLGLKELGMWIYLKAISFEAKSFALLIGKA